MSFAKRERERTEEVHTIIGTMTGPAMLAALLADAVFMEDLDGHLKRLALKQNLKRDDLEPLQRHLTEALTDACSAVAFDGNDRPLVGSYKSYAVGDRKEMAALAQVICDRLHTALSIPQDRTP